MDTLTTEQLIENSEKRQDEFQFLNRSFDDSLDDFVSDNYDNKCSTSTSNKQAQNELNFFKFNELNNEFANTKKPNESKTDVSANEGNLLYMNFLSTRIVVNILSNKACTRYPAIPLGKKKINTL